MTDSHEKEDDLILLRSGDLHWIDALAERLQQKGIPFQLDIDETEYNSYHHTHRVDLYVSPDFLEQAKEIDTAFYFEQVPDAHPEQIQISEDTSHCPACGYFLDTGTPICPDCGLEFPSFREDKEEED